MLMLLAVGCATPAERFRERAMKAGFEPRLVRGAGFEHVVFVAPRRGPTTLHVYLDGDGVPWEAGQPAADPTPRRPLVLRLMARDAAPAVYVGRPCYHGLAGSPGCGPDKWNEARYSPVIVDSLTAVVTALLDEGGYTRVVLVGYSGGGTLAMLVAPRISRTVAVVTVAANLDTDGWAAHHRLPPLRGSLNPSRQSPLPPTIVQRHYTGSDDRVVPQHVVAVPGLPVDAVRRVNGFDHVCCWVERWPSILDEVGRSLSAR
jgi:pimeloyl-ACP methyl ester carboxylesterase